MSWISDDLGDGYADDLALAIERAQLGLAWIDADLIVRRRVGALAQWLPNEGTRCDASGVLFAMGGALDALREPDAPALALPSLGLPGVLDGRFSVTVVWNPATQRFIVTVVFDAGAAQWDRLLLRERRQAEVLRQQAAAAADRLSVSATLYRDIVEATGDAVLRLGPDLTVLFANGPAGALFGMPADAVVGKPVRDLAPLPAAGNPWRRDISVDGPASFEQPVRASDGALRWLWWHVRWLGEAGGNAEFQAVGRDVTELRRLRAELERANEQAQAAALAQERLRIAHDLHDTFIHTLVDTMSRLSLLRRAAPEGPLRQEIAEAEREARAGLRAAREAVGAMRSDLAFLEHPAAPVIAAAEALRAKMKVAIEVERELGRVDAATGAAIARIAREAMRNVERHSGARAATVSLRIEHDELVLRIVDDGVGFAPDPPPAGHFGLTGMREQAQLAGGRFAIETAPNQGARVTVRFPSP